MPFERIDLLGVPVDVIPPEEIEPILLDMMHTPGAKQIVFLSIWDLLKARRRGIFGETIKAADIVIPISKSILKGAAFLKKTEPFRYEPFSTVITILTILEKHYKTIYMLGGRPRVSTYAAQNVKATYPNLHLVGRYPGHYPKQMEKDIVAAIFKASPSLILLSEGIQGQESWLYTRRDTFSSGIFMYYKDAIPIFAKCKKHIRHETFEKGLEVYGEIARNPLRAFRVFRYILYWYLLFRTRIKLNKALVNAEQ